MSHYYRRPKVQPKVTAEHGTITDAQRRVLRWVDSRRGSSRRALLFRRSADVRVRRLFRQHNA